MSGKLALIIGNSVYEDRSLAQLATPDADVNALAEVLRDPEIGGFDEVVALVDQPATTIRRAIAAFFVGRGRDDLLLLYFSGHGIRDDRGQLFLAAKDTEHSLLRGTGIPAAYITDEMDNSRSRRQVLILDCCHSGAFARGMKGAPGTSVGTATAFEGTGSGRVVLTATDSTQYAWEGDQVIGQAENSVFTHYLIQGLRTGEGDTDADGKITLDELYNYVYEQVVHETPMQTPGKWSYGQQGEMVIARNPRPVLKPVELPPDLQQTIDDPRPWVREGAVHELDRLARGSSPGLALAAQEALQRMAEDDSRRVATAATVALAAYEERLRQTEETKSEETARTKTERQAARKDEKERLARQKAETERKAKEEAERLERQRAQQEQLLREKADAERKAKEDEERLRRQQAEQEQLSRQKVVTERVERERLATQPAEAGLITGEEPGQEPSASVETGTQAPSVRKLTDALPRWAIWVGLVLVGGLIVGLMVSRQLNLAGMASRTATQNAAVAFSPTKAFSADTPSAQLTATSPGIVPLRDPPSAQQTPASLGISLPTNTPPPPLSTVEPTETAGRIAFVSDRDGNQEIYVMNADGSNQARLTNNSGHDWNPTWSPDGTRIAFVSYRDDTQEIYVMNADGSDQSRLTNDYFTDQAPAWSPDGTRIAFVSYRDGNKEICMMNADGSDQSRLTSNADADQPVWSPDGTRIAFPAGDFGTSDIYVMNVDGSEKTRLTGSATADDEPAWSPDGTRIAYSATRNVYLTSPEWEIYVMNADGSGQTRLTNMFAYNHSPAWSPDGTLIAFTSGRNIFIMSIDGTGRTQLTDNSTYAANLTWSPDGTRIAFISSGENAYDIYVVNIDGSGLTRLTENVSYIYPAWQP